MKLLYVVNTKHDADAYRVYTRVHMDGRVTRVNQVISLLAGSLITAGGVMAVVQQGPRLLYLATILMGLLVLAGRPLGLYRMRNRLLKNANNLQTVFDYRFGDNAFDVSYPGESMSCPYGNISRIVETQDYYFVYVDVRMAHILPKKDFSQGDANTFGKFIAEKTGLKLEWNKAK